MVGRGLFAEAKSKSDRALIKVEESKLDLKLYLPQNAASLWSCYRSQLLAQLMRILGIDHLGAEKQIYRLLTEEITQLQDVMVDEDIPHVSWLECPKIPAEENEHAAPATRLELTTAAAAFKTTNKHLNLTVKFPIGRMSELPVEIPEPTRPTAKYRQLLEKVVTQAQQIFGEKQDLDSLSMTSVREALDEVSLPLNMHQILGIQASQATSFEACAKIGAAGELFVRVS